MKFLGAVDDDLQTCWLVQGCLEKEKFFGLDLLRLQIISGVTLTLPAHIRNKAASSLRVEASSGPHDPYIPVLYTASTVSVASRQVNVTLEFEVPRQVRLLRLTVSKDRKLCDLSICNIAANPYVVEPLTDRLLFVIGRQLDLENPTFIAAMLAARSAPVTVLYTKPDAPHLEIYRGVPDMRCRGLAKARTLFTVSPVTSAMT